jgi:hypothetical protein
MGFIQPLRPFDLVIFVRRTTLHISKVEEEESGSSLTEIIEVASGGDVVLVVGEDKVKLRVHSLFLNTALKPFYALFGPDFSEGQNITRDCPKEIILPEDNADTLKIICSVIHLWNSAVPGFPTPGEAFPVAITADKYDCIDAFKYASQH